MSHDDRQRRPSSATTASTSTERTSSTNHSRNDSGGSAVAASPSATTAWTAADDDMLASARAAGMNWQPIATRFFPNKSANACRKRHERLMERRYQEEWEQDRLEELATAYFDVRKEMWAILGERLGERWTLVESKCMEKGLKNLHTIARASTRKRARLDSSPGRTPELDHEMDSVSDAELGIVDNRPSSTPTIGTKRSRSPSSSPASIRHLPKSADLPLYHPPPPPPPAIRLVDAYTTAPGPMHTPRSITASPLSAAPSPLASGVDMKPLPAFGSRRDVLRIQSILSPAD